GQRRRPLDRVRPDPGVPSHARDARPPHPPAPLAPPEARRGSRRPGRHPLPADLDPLAQRRHDPPLPPLPVQHPPGAQAGVGPAGRGFRLWPVYGHKEVIGSERTSYILWPFHIRRERLVPGYGWERTRVDFPLVSAIDGAGRRSRFYGIFLYTHTVDERQAYE